MSLKIHYHRWLSSGGAEGILDAADWVAGQTPRSINLLDS